MKEFDIELAKAGHPVCTRDGKPVRILCYDRRGNNYPIVTLIDKGGYEEYQSFTINGKYYIDIRTSDNDLFMASVKKEGWINVYSNGERACTHSADIHLSKEDALKCHFPDTYVDTVKIEWEE